MAMDAHDIERLIKQGIPDARVTIQTNQARAADLAAQLDTAHKEADQAKAAAKAAGEEAAKLRGKLEAKGSKAG